MNNKLKWTVTALAVLACGSAFAEVNKTKSCEGTERAVNAANYILLMKTPLLAGDVRNVKIVSSGIGHGNTSTNTLALSRCGLLEKRLLVAKTRMAGDKTSVQTSNLQREGNGWMMEAQNVIKDDASKKSLLTLKSTRHFSTDKLGRISLAVQEARDKELVSKTTWSYHYDDRHRLLQEEVLIVINNEEPKKFLYDFEYDSRGLLTAISGDLRSQTFRWDDKGRLVSSHDINKINEMELIKDTTCSVWDDAGNCTTATLEEIFRPQGSDEQEPVIQTSLSYQYQYQNN